MFSNHWRHSCVPLPLSAHIGALTLSGCVLVVLNESSQAKVSNLAHQIVSNQNVCCSQVTVDVVHSLNVCHPRRNLHQETERAHVDGCGVQVHHCLSALASPVPPYRPAEAASGSDLHRLLRSPINYLKQRQFKWIITKIEFVHFVSLTILFTRLWSQKMPRNFFSIVWLKLFCKFIDNSLHNYFKWKLKRFFKKSYLWWFQLFIAGAKTKKVYSK